jgi:protoheme IX farnesyltransferase
LFAIFAAAFTNCFSINFMSAERALEGNISVMVKVKEFARLMKLRLASLVVFSAGVTYVTAADTINWSILIWVLIGGLLVTGAANGYNQVIEQETDKLMARTANRPLPIGTLNTFEGLAFCSVIGAAGIVLLWTQVNMLSAILGLLAIVLYALVYTPMKKVSPLAVFVGAFPGALPTMIGWVAADGDITIGAWTMFAIQFIWQFPHFWSIAWILHDDYEKAGFKMMPTAGGRTSASAIQMVIYSLFLVPMGFLPYWLGLTGIVSAIIAVVAALLFTYQAYKLLKALDVPSAKRLMFASIIYLPVVQLAYMFDKI